MGHALTLQLLAEGHQVTLLNRGMGEDSLPEGIARLRADRTDARQMQRALLAKTFDAVVDFVVFNEREASMIAELLRGSTGHYIFISTGQVYLVRENTTRPFTEDQYAGRVMPAPKENTYAYEEWRYGMDKRAAEEVFQQAHARHGFPFTSLRLPMVNSERDPFKRLYSYILRLKDGGPILIPETPDHPLRHIYSGDVVQAVLRLLHSGPGRGRAYNISQEETVRLEDFLGLLGELLHVEPKIRRFKHSELEANGFLPYCSPFSERWMSELANDLSRQELGMHYTPLAEYLARLVTHYETTRPAVPVGYRRRNAELQYAAMNPEPAQG